MAVYLFKLPLVRERAGVGHQLPPQSSSLSPGVQTEAVFRPRMHGEQAASAAATAVALRWGERKKNAHNGTRRIMEMTDVYIFSHKDICTHAAFRRRTRQVSYYSSNL